MSLFSIPFMFITISSVCVMREMGGMKLHPDPPAGNSDLNLNKGKA